jgi:hypothetical protein
MLKAVLILLLAALTACNLTTQRPTAIAPTAETLTEAPLETADPLNLPTILPSLAPPPLLLRDVSGGCNVYITYSGVDPNNKLSLRGEPNTSAVQLLKLPNNVQVYQLAGTQEVEAEGYHWLNIFYVDAQQVRYEGWAARDSFEQGGVRDPSIATLRATGQQAAC